MEEFRLLKRLKKYRRRIAITLFVLSLLGIFGLKSYGASTASDLECNTLTLPAAETLPGAGAMRIAFLADVHNNPKLFSEAIAHIEAAKPDLILFGGDLVTAYQRFMRTRWAIEGLRRLAAIAPCFAILGNHDYEKQEQVERVFATAGVPLLRNMAVDWTTPSGATLRIIGLGDYNEGDDAPARCMQPRGQEAAPVLLLSHDPESRWKLRSYDWDFMLSGHNHGGQLGNPFTGEYISMRSSMPAGSYSFEGGRRVFVTRGIGSILGMRFFCRPELNIIDLK